MNIDPSMLIPLIGMLGQNKDGAKMDTEKLASVLTGLKSGDTAGMLQALGGGDEKTKTLLSVMNMLPGLMKSGKSEATPPAPVKPPPDPRQTIMNSEINRALYTLFKEKQI